MVKNILFTMMFLVSGVLANTLGLDGNGDGTWNVTYSSDEIIGGFQFNVDGATVNSASGGDATANGFMISSNSTTVLGFSLTGGTIPAGGGTLVVLYLEGNSTGLSGIVIADPSGNALDFSFDSGDVTGCTDMDACNYNADATADDGSCDYGTMCWDGSYECDSSDCPDQPGGSVDVMFNSDTPIAGFQFGVNGVDVTGVGGGAAAGGYRPHGRGGGSCVQ